MSDKTDPPMPIEAMSWRLVAIVLAAVVLTVGVATLMAPGGLGGYERVSRAAPFPSPRTLAPLPITGLRKKLPKPSPELKPGQVVRLIVESLGHNNEPFKNAGIMTTFNFASPANQRVTGPLEHFIDIVKSPQYRVMLHYERAEYGPVKVHNGRARQIVRLYTDSRDQPAVFLFKLSKQKHEKVRGCWMTDGVRRLRRPHRTSPEPEQQDKAQRTIT